MRECREGSELQSPEFIFPLAVNTNKERYGACVDADPKLFVPHDTDSELGSRTANIGPRN
jgi:hypothetical protein